MSLFKKKRQFYVKISNPYFGCANYTTGVYENAMVTSISKADATKFTDAEYDHIKPLLPKDHTLELVK